MAIGSILLDTNAYTAFKKGDQDIIVMFSRVSKICLNLIVLGELRGGFAAGNREAKNLGELQKFLNSIRVALLQIDQNTATQYAQIYKQLRQAGTPIPTNDMWIAAVAHQYDIPLLTNDKHFQAVRGLKIITSPKDLL